MFRHWQLSVIFSIVAGILSGCTGGQEVQGYPIVTGGHADRGRQIMVQRHCGSCHTIPGIRNADGVFGPPLRAFGRRSYIAGNFPNTPNYLVRWIMSPPSMKPKTSMPDLGLSEQQARDITAYLYTLR